MIATHSRAWTGGLCVCLAFVLFAPAAFAETRTLSYQALLAVDDPAKAKPAAEPTAAKPSVTNGEAPATSLDNETPAALRPGGDESTPAVTEEAANKVAQPQPSDEEDSVFKKWWFWTMAAAIVGSTVALGVWAAKPEDTPARPCAAGFLACFGDGRD